MREYGTGLHCELHDYLQQEVIGHGKPTPREECRHLVNTTDSMNRVPTLLLTKNPGLFQNFPKPHEKFSRTFS